MELGLGTYDTCVKLWPYLKGRGEQCWEDSLMGQEQTGVIIIPPPRRQEHCRPEDRPTSESN